MSSKERLHHNLVSARNFSEALLAKFKTPQEWTHQVHPQANHALWFAGHMSTVDNFFLSVVSPQRARDEPGFSERFGMGSRPSSNPADYPPVENVLATMRDRRQELLAALDAMSEADLARPTPPGTPEFLPDMASVFEMAVWHEGLHSGQLSVASRALGHGPLFG